MTGDLFDHAAHMERARRLRDAGMALAVDHAEDAPPDWPTYFCGSECRREFESLQPLQNLLDKRRLRRERG